MLTLTDYNDEPVNAFMDRYHERFGAFDIDGATIRQQPHVALAIMRDMLIVRAEYMFDRAVVRYTAMHPSFALCRGRTTPVYLAKLHALKRQNPDDPPRFVVTWKQSK